MSTADVVDDSQAQVISLVALQEILCLLSWFRQPATWRVRRRYPDREVRTKQQQRTLSKIYRILRSESLPTTHGSVLPTHDLDARVH